jgi:site-specific DNA recombinase
VKLEATEALRGLVSEIRMIPDAEARGGHRIELFGELAAILSLSESAGAVFSSLGPDMTKPPRLARAGADHGRSGFLVAGVGFEPTTFRL